MIRDFKGIWIPKEIWLSKDLTLQERLFYVEIDSLDNEEGCFATNAYFAEFFEISKTRVSLVIKSLIEKKYITSTIIYKEGTKEILKRVLNISYRPYLTKVKDPIQQKLKDNNTVNNTVNNTINKTTTKSVGFNSLIETFTQNVELRETISDFIKMRKEIKANMTSNAVKLLLNKLSKMARTDEMKIKILEQSIMNSWKGIFEIKDNNYRSKEGNYGKSIQHSEDSNRDGIGFELEAN